MDKYSWVGRMGVFSLAVFFCSASLAGTYSGGDGSSGAPYQIGTVQDWLELIASESDWDKHFELIADIDFGGAALTPVGTSEQAPFTGVMDGRDQVLRNAVMHWPDTSGVGLFGYCSGAGGGGILKNLVVEDVSVEGRNDVGILAGYTSGAVLSCNVSGEVSGRERVGALVGYNYGGAIEDAHAAGAVIARSTAGGLVGYNYGTIVSCSAANDVASRENTEGTGVFGGLVGSNTEGSVDASYASGAVTGYFGIGGLVGYNTSGSITSSYASGAVTGHFEVGGLAGGMEGRGRIISSFATGPVVGSQYVGGLAGRAILIVGSYATGAVQGGESVGGLAGEARVVIASYATGVVSGETWVGGLAGACCNRGWDCFWDTDTSGIPKSATGKGIPSARMRSLEVFRNANWAAHDWVMEPGSPPRLAWEGLGWAPIPPPLPLPLAGSGTSADPYRITLASEFALLSWHYFPLDAHFRLMRDIDLAGVALYPIRDGYGNSTGDLIGFAGVFEGGGHRIRNASILGDANYPGLEDHVGLFARVAEDGIIRNLTLENVAINAPGAARKVGAIAGRSAGHLHACTVSGNISGDGYVGGVVGASSGRITLCRADVSVAAGIMALYSPFAGGLAGHNQGEISGSSAVGAVEGIYAGGLVGSNSGSIVSSHAGVAVTGRNAGGLVGAGGHGRIERSSATGAVIGTNPPELEHTMSPAVGGLVGGTWNTEIAMCYATGDVSGVGWVGGLVGYCERSVITDSYARGHVREQVSQGIGNWLGGLVAYTSGPGLVARCYAAGRMTRLNPLSLRGGLVAQQEPGRTDPLGDVEGPLTAFYRAYWNTQLSGVTTSAAGEGRNTSAMTYPYALNTYVEWDFETVWKADYEGTVNNGYPWLPGAVYAPPAQVAISGSPRVEKGDYMVLRVSLPPAIGNVTIDWYKDGVLIWSDGDPDYIVPYATEEDSGVYYAIITDEDDTCHRTPNFIVRVFEEGSLPVAHPLCLMVLSLLLIACAGRCAKRRS